jgi:hypothetical protein
MASPPKPVERVMLETVAFHDPIDYHRLRRLVGERLHGEYSSSRHREALENLQELDLVERGGIGHEYVHLSDAGWSHLGGETTRHGDDAESVDGPVCDVCETDALAEASR